MHHHVNLFWLTFLMLTNLPLQGAASPGREAPETPVRNVEDKYFDTTVTDPYRWLENTRSPEVVSWIQGQNEFARSTLESIPGRTELKKRVQELGDQGVDIFELQKWGGRIFYLKVTPGSEVKKLCWREENTGVEKVLVDPQGLSEKDSHQTVDHFFPSYDGRHVAYGMSRGGSEDSILHVMDVETGKILNERIDRTRFAAVSWRPDNRAFFYSRLRETTQDTPPAERFSRNRVFLHVLGANPKDDQPVFGFGMSPDVQVGENDFVSVKSAPGSRHILGIISDGAFGDLIIYSSTLSDLRTGKLKWTKVVDKQVGVKDYALAGETLYLLSHRDAPRSQVLKVTLGVSPLNLSVVVPGSDLVLQQMGLSRNSLYLKELRDGLGHLRRVRLRDGKVAEVTLPFPSSIRSIFISPLREEAWLTLTSWTRSPALLIYNENRRRFERTSLIPPSPANFSDVESAEVKVKSKDGTLVPLSLVHKRGTVRNGRNPTWLAGYGSYGIPLVPNFSPTLLAWLERGGIYAVAHVRGGGEYGEEWHEAGQFGKKQNSIDDFIACAEYLSEQAYTSPKHLAAQTGSGGGITLGSAIMQRPELFAAAVFRSASLDRLRMELTEGGPANTHEFGTVKVREDFKNLLAMSPYYHLQDGTAYPGVLFTAGMNDRRVPVWQAAKMAARLQRASSSRKPVLLRVEYDAGHGASFGSTKSQIDAELADIMAFMFWQTGHSRSQNASRADTPGGG